MPIEARSDIRIRLIEREDGAAIFKLTDSNRQRLTTYFPKTVTEVEDIKTAEKFARQKEKMAWERMQYYFLIEEVTTVEVIGMVFLKNIIWTVPKGELAYFIDTKHENKGYATWAIKLVVDYCFGQLKMQKLYLKVSPTNVPSKKVALKNGFEKEGLLKREFRTGDGDLCDVERYGLLFYSF